MRTSNKHCPVIVPPLILRSLLCAATASVFARHVWCAEGQWTDGAHAPTHAVDNSSQKPTLNLLTPRVPRDDTPAAPRQLSGAHVQLSRAARGPNNITQWIKGPTRLARNDSPPPLRLRVPQELASQPSRRSHRLPASQMPTIIPQRPFCLSPKRVHVAPTSARQSDGSSARKQTPTT